MPNPCIRLLSPHTLVLSALLAGCGRTQLSDDDAWGESNVSDGGGDANQGGAPGIGAEGAIGGMVPTGGSWGAGGKAATGGRATGGERATGGIGVGGKVASGGQNTDGRLSSGGNDVTGGTRASGGTQNSGGTRSTGGITSSGGTRAIGGTSAAQTNTLGGATVVGGTASSSDTTNTGGAKAGGQSNSGGSSQSNGGSDGGLGGSEWYVDAALGDDQALGTMAYPFRTLQRAAQAAQEGDTVNLFDGIWDLTLADTLGGSDDPCDSAAGLAFAGGVTLRAVHAGAARIIGGRFSSLCLSSGVVDGLRLECGEPSQPVLVTQQGNLVITGTSVRNCNVTGIRVAGTADVHITPGNAVDYTESPSPCFAMVRDSASLSIDGGRVTVSGVAIQVQDSSRLSVNNLTFAAEPSATPLGVVMRGDSWSLHMSNVAFTRYSYGVQGYGGLQGVSVSIEGMLFTYGHYAVYIEHEYAADDMPIHIKNSKVFDSSGPGVEVIGAVALNLEGSSFERLESTAVVVIGSGSAKLTDVDIRNSHAGLAASGAFSSDSLSLSARRVSITGCSLVGAYLVSGDPPDEFDFGTVASPGENTFVDNNVSGSTDATNLWFQLPAGSVTTAVGNTWTPDQQGADASGRYYAPDGGGPLDVKVGRGPNFVASTYNAGVLRLAE